MKNAKVRADCMETDMVAIPNKTAPSGALFTTYSFDLAERMVRAGSIRWSDEPYSLDSGVESNVYVYLREDLTDNPDLLNDISDLIGSHTLKIKGDDPRQACLIGIPTAGTSLAIAATQTRRALWPKPKIAARVMRETLKGHGAHRSWVNGRPDTKIHWYETVDNTITDGGSKLRIIERLKEDGYPTEEMNHLVVVDRQQGGMEKLRAQGIKIHALFNLLDLAWAFGILGAWSKERIEAVEREIAAHQIS